MGFVDDEALKDIANSFVVQKNQRERAERVITQANKELDYLDKVNTDAELSLDELLQQAESLAKTMGVSEVSLTGDEFAAAVDSLELTAEERNEIIVPYFDVLSTVDTSEDWNEYFNNIKAYVKEKDIDLAKDPFSQMLTEIEKNELGQRVRDDYLLKAAHCDKYDYIIAAFCGIVSGIIDSFFVGMPTESKLGDWTDKQADNYIQWFSKKLWNLDSKKRDEIQSLFKNKKINIDKRNIMLKEAGIPYNQNISKEPESLQQCIQYLEKKFGVNYDASSAAYIQENDVLEGMRPMNHHIMSLAHSPSPIGLIFSIIDQFTGKATLVDNGKLIRVTPVKKKNQLEEFELRGSTFPTRLICGVVNWLGHLSSDFVGANTTRSVEGKRGSGLPVPFMELMQMCTFEVPDGRGKVISINELTIKMFENGYDVRFAAACSIPVVINEFFIRLLWSLKSRFYHHNDWKDSIPFGNHPELRRMLLVGHGTLCIVDAGDAAIRSGGEIITFSMHLNAVAWARLAFSGIQEVRAIYRENVVDVTALDDDLMEDWTRLQGELSVYA